MRSYGSVIGLAKKLSRKGYIDEAEEMIPGNFRKIDRSTMTAMKIASRSLAELEAAGCDMEVVSITPSDEFIFGNLGFYRLPTRWAIKIVRHNDLKNISWFEKALKDKVPGLMQIKHSKARDLYFAASEADLKSAINLAKTWV